jgi:hypothetical protein
VQADSLISKICTETSELMKESVGFGLNMQSFLNGRQVSQARMSYSLKQEYDERCGNMSLSVILYAKTPFENEV